MKHQPLKTNKKVMKKERRMKKIKEI